MDMNTIKGTLVYKEMNDDLAKEWFSYKAKKFIFNTDNLYFNIDIQGDIPVFLSGLSIIQNEAIKSGQPQAICEDVFVTEDKRISKYHITKPYIYDIFINDTATLIHVQLRSKGLWLDGLENTLNSSLADIRAILEPYGVIISAITENRLDLAHHTNYIQDFNSFFKKENMASMQVSRFTRGSIQWENKNDKTISDYVSLGNRSSKNIFLRIYDKSKEVVQQNYKQFFIPIWYDNGLISKFDKYIFDDICENAPGQWKYRHTSRCRFYLEHGQDDFIKDNIQRLLSQRIPIYSEYKRLADSCVPDVTTITNIEFQVGRNFTRSIPDTDIPSKIDTERISPCSGEIPTYINDSEKCIRSIIHAVPAIRKHLTTETIRFVNYKGKYRTVKKGKRPIADWWTRLSSCSDAKANATLCRDYQHEADVQRSKIRAINAIASFSAHNNRNGSSLEADLEAITYTLNDNDIQRYHTSRTKALMQME